MTRNKRVGGIEDSIEPEQHKTKETITEAHVKFLFKIQSDLRDFMTERAFLRSEVSKIRPSGRHLGGRTSVSYEAMDLLRRFCEKWDPRFHAIHNFLDNELEFKGTVADEFYNHLYQLRRYLRPSDGVLDYAENKCIDLLSFIRYIPGIEYLEEMNEISDNNIKENIALEFRPLPVPDEPDLTARGTPRIHRRKRTREEIGGDPLNEAKRLDVKINARIPVELRDAFLACVTAHGMKQGPALREAIADFLEKYGLDEPS